MNRLKRILSVFSVKNKILISYFLPILLPVIILLGINLYQSAGIIEKNAMAEFSYVVESARQQLDQYILDIAALSYNLYESDTVRERFNQDYIPSEQWKMQQIQDANTVKQYLYGLYKLKSGISSIILYGLNGIYDYFHNDRIWNDNYTPFDEEWYQHTLNSDGQWFLSPQREERQFVTNYHPVTERVVTFSRLIRDLDTLKPLAILCINIKVETLENIVMLKTVPYYMIIKNQQNELILDSRSKTNTIDPNDLLTAISISSVTGWEISYMTPKAELFSQSNDLRTFAIISILSISGLALVLAQLISRGIVRPISRIMESMNTIDNVKRTASIQRKGEMRSKDEIAILEERYMLMISQIQSLMEENRLKEAQKSRIMLNALQARINPHFLYNTLNGIRMVSLSEGEGKTAKLIESLVYLLRFSFKNTDQMITVHQESILLRHYLQIMQARSENFEYDITITPDATLVGICPFTLQPIVENAIFHGMTPLIKRGRLKITVDCDENVVCASIQDNGVGMSKTVMEAIEANNTLSPESGTSISSSGIANVLNRLKLQFGLNAQIHVSKVKPRGVIVRLVWKKTLLTQSNERNTQ